jgi:spore coat polysaccharide biosynthesis protein SpsF
MMTEKIVALIPARLNSTRLPCKQLREINGEAMLSCLVDRMNAVPQIDEVVIATSTQHTDDLLVEWAEQKDIGVYRGDLDDVLGRLYAAGEKWDADIVIRANGDNPLLAPEVTSAGIVEIQDCEYEYVPGKHMFTGLPVGLGPEVIRQDTLSYLDGIADDSYHREHVTTYVIENLRDFEWRPIPVKDSWIQRGMSLTVDTKQQFEFAKSVIESLGTTKAEEWGIEEIISTTRKIRFDYEQRNNDC